MLFQMISSADLFTRTQQTINSGLPGEESQLKMAPAFRPKGPANQNPPPRKAAVLIPVFFSSEGNPEILLTLRKTYDGVHSGQVSFPGGKFDPHETDPVEVALRESQEEVGLDPAAVKIAGLLSPLYIPVSHMMVQPVVGFVEGPVNWIADPREVERLISISMESLTDPSLVQNKAVRISANLTMEAPFYSVANETVWGATAMILSEWIEVWKKISE